MGLGRFAVESAIIITVVGVVFSIMIVTLTLASTRFGPRMLRTFIRDRGTHRYCSISCTPRASRSGTARPGPALTVSLHTVVK